MANALSPRTTPRLAEVPSPGATEVGASRVAACPDVTLDLAGAFAAPSSYYQAGEWAVSFRASTTYFPFFEGKMFSILLRLTSC